MFFNDIFILFFFILLIAGLKVKSLFSKILIEVFFLGKVTVHILAEFNYSFHFLDFDTPLI